MELSAGRTSVPPRIAARTASGGLLGAMPGYISGVLEAKVVSVFPQNHVRGLPSHQGLIALFDEDTGAPLAVMDGVAITAIRTGASAAVAARWLARPEASTLAILGAGVQGRSHLAAFPRVRDFKEIRDRLAQRRDRRGAGRAESATRKPVATFKEAVQGADVVCCCTDAREPVIKYEWLGAGRARELGRRDVRPRARRADDRRGHDLRRVARRGPAARRRPAPTSCRACRPESVTEIGEVIAGTQPGEPRRTSSPCTSRPGTRSRTPRRRAWCTSARWPKAPASAVAL